MNRILFSILLFFIVNQLYSQKKIIITGDVSIRTNCTDGKVNGVNGGCLYEVKFHNENNLSLEQAKTVASYSGWTLATADELSAAYNRLNYGHFAYGMLADGQMSVPVQSDMGTFKKGVNIGVNGGNQGFFYTIKPGTPIVKRPPAVVAASPSNNTIKLSGNAGNPIAINNSEGGFYAREFFKLNGIPYKDSDAAKYREYEKKYANGIGNIMQDKWDDANYQPILNRALSRYIVEKFPNSYRDNSIHLFEYLKSLILSKDENCTDCEIARYEFVGFFVPEYLKMLRTGSNPALRQQFSEYVSYHIASASRKSLVAWKYYSRRNSAQLRDEPFIPGLNLNAGPTLIDQNDLGTAQSYDRVTMSSIFIKSAVPLPGKSVNDFKENGMNGSPMYFTFEQNLVVMDFVMPVAAQSFQNDQGVKLLLSVPNYFSKNLSAEAKALNIAESIGIRAGTGAAIGGTLLFSGFALQALQLSAEIARSLSGPITNAVVHNIGGQLVEKSVTTITSVGVNSSALGSNAIGPALVNAIGPIAAGVGVFMVGFMPTGGKAIEIAIFEDNLKKDSYIKDRQQDWMAMKDAEKIENFSFLFKMLVVDAKDFTYLIPADVADKAEQRRLETAAANYIVRKDAKQAALKNQIMSTLDARYLIPDMHHYSEDGLTLAQAKSKAQFHGWTLATENELNDAWSSGFQAFAYLRMADGRFAVPIQKDIQQFKKGANIGVVGGNQGFLYTVKKGDYKRIRNYWKKDMYIQSQGKKAIKGVKSVTGNADQWKMIPAANGWFRIQSLENPELYLNFSGSTLEVVSIKPNWASALWKLIPTHSGYGRLQNNWYPEKVIHIEYGKLEIGPIQPNSWSAMWKFE